MGRWDESDHPRDDRGRFRDNTDGWAQTVSGALGGRHTYQRGRNIWDEADWETIYAGAADPRDEGAPIRSISFRKVQRQLYALQGYDQPPHVVDGAELDRLVEQEGYIEVWRGVGGSVIPHPDPEQAARGKLKSLNARGTARRFITDPEHYVGEGFFGNGTYTTADREDALDYGSAVIRMGLHPDARVYEIRWHDMGMDTEDLGEFDWKNDSPAKLHALTELSNRAVALGYDAIRVPARGRLRGSSKHDYYIILNRGAVAVEQINE